MKAYSTFSLMLAAALAPAVNAQDAIVPDASPEVSPQYSRLVIKNANLIDGTGVPVDIEISGGRIASITSSSPLARANAASNRRASANADRVIDAA